MDERQIEAVTRLFNLAIMKKFYKVIYDEDIKRKQIVVEDYDTGSFNMTTFWHGVTYNSFIPSDVRLYLNSKKPVAPDYLANPISWPICSERLVNIFQERASKYIQTFDAPLFDYQTKKPLTGYQVVNITRLISCLDFSKSNISFSDDGKEIVSVIDPVYVESKLPQDAHIFRVVEDLYSVVISSEMANDFVRERVTGIALIECKAV